MRKIENIVRDKLKELLGDKSRLSAIIGFDSYTLTIEFLKDDILVRIDGLIELPKSYYTSSYKMLTNTNDITVTLILEFIKQTPLKDYVRW